MGSSSTWPVLGKAPSTSKGNNSHHQHLHPPCPVKCNSTTVHGCPEKGMFLVVGTWNILVIMKASRELEIARVEAGMLLMEWLPCGDWTLQAWLYNSTVTFYPGCPPCSPGRLIAMVDSRLSTQSNTKVLTSSHLNIWLGLDFHR